MKFTVFAVALLFLLQVTDAKAQKVYTYQFSNNLLESSSGPKLTAVCKPVYADHTFTFNKTKVNHPVCHFDKQCGFIFNDTGNFLAAGSYTIEMYVELDAVTGYNKLVDYMNLAEDNGLYENNGACTFRGPGTVSGDLFTNGTYNFVTITRDGITKNVKMFVNGQYVDGFTDNGEFTVAMYDANKTLRFIQDDNYSNGNECGVGNIALLKIYNYALDPNTAMGHYASLGALLNEPAPVKNAAVVK